jgi:hypothetical protein
MKQGMNPSGRMGPGSAAMSLSPKERLRERGTRRLAAVQTVPAPVGTGVL